jgi:hypothetical protein
MSFNYIKSCITSGETVLGLKCVFHSSLRYLLETLFSLIFKEIHAETSVSFRAKSLLNMSELYEKGLDNFS